MALPSKIFALVKVSMARSPPNLIRRLSLRPRLDILPLNAHKNARNARGARMAGTADREAQDVEHAGGAS
jgi:hypothetical protein